jgi:hypothetical protein
MNELRRDDGWALPLVLSVIVLIFAFSAVAVVLSTHATDRSNRDRSSARSLQAAEAGADVAQYRLNKALATAPVTGILGVAPDVVRQFGCINVDVNGALQVTRLDGDGWCSPVASEQADIGLPDDGTGAPATYRYWVSTAAQVGSGSGAKLRRRIVAVGENADTVRRVMVTVEADLNLSTSNPFDLFDRISFVECSSEVPGNDDPAAGCAA